jgi:hypothetical protein
MSRRSMRVLARTRHLDEEEEEETEGVNEEMLAQVQAEIRKDERELEFFDWMTERDLRLPLQQWELSRRLLVTVLSTRGLANFGYQCTGSGRICLPIYRAEILQEAAAYFVRVYGGSYLAVLASMIEYYK